MKILNKLAQKNTEPYSRPATLAFLGDSVTQGCFEVYQVGERGLETIYDQENAPCAHLKRLLANIFPKSPINIINAGISGDNATNGAMRLERDVLSYKPDLVVVCFGLNDCATGEAGLDSFKANLTKIVRATLLTGAEVILMTPNASAEEVSPQVKNLHQPYVEGCIEAVAKLAQEGVLDRYVDGIREVAQKEGVALCDVYAKWLKLRQSGAKTYDMLANYCNHPTRGMNAVFAHSLLDTMLEN